MQSHTSAIHPHKLGTDWGKDTFVEENQALAVGESTSHQCAAIAGKANRTMGCINESKSIRGNVYVPLLRPVRGHLTKYIQFGDFTTVEILGKVTSKVSFYLDCTWILWLPFTSLLPECTRRYSTEDPKEGKLLLILNRLYLYTLGTKKQVVCCFFLFF